MIVLEISKNFEFGGIAITDWIQSVGALIAIVAAIIGFIQLFRKSNENQLQIDSLTKLANQSETQSQQLAAQVEQMIEGNRLQAEHINLLQKSILISESDSKSKDEQRKLDEERRKFDIRPRIEYDGGAGGQENMQYFFKNKGGSAKIIRYEALEHNSCIITFNQNIEKEIQKNERFGISFNALSDLKLIQCNVSVKLIYRDIDKNEYYQIIEGNPKLGLKANKPIENK